MNPTVLPDPSPEEAQALLRSERFRKLAGELRCLVCQNQTLADSNAELAGDLRAEVLRQMASGKDDAAIKTHLVERFGEFVLYRPTLSAHNLGLWAGPAVLAALGGVALWRLTRRRSLLAAARASDTSLERIDALLGPISADPGSTDPSPPQGEGPHARTRRV